MFGLGLPAALPSGWVSFGNEAAELPDAGAVADGLDPQAAKNSRKVVMIAAGITFFT
jgi:hypothetical protein